MKFVFVFFAFLIPFLGFTQVGTIQGVVKNREGRLIEYATVGLEGTTFGGITFSDGSFELAEIPYGKYVLKVQLIGFEIYVEHLVLNKESISLEIVLKESDNQLDAVVVSGTLKPISKSESPVPVEVYSKEFFDKNPVTSIFEAMSNVNGVRPQLNCNVCNTGDIHINGLEGPYTMILIDGMPIVSGLSTVYGLMGIPKSLIDRVEIVKGPASSLYGSEAVGGIINIITKRPESAPLVSLESMGSTWGEINSDLGFKFTASKKATSILGVNYFNYAFPIDNNGDGMTDLTLQNRISIFNKWSFNRKKNRVFSMAGRYLYEDRWGGELNWTPKYRGGDVLYGESIYTSRWEAFGVYQLPVKEKIDFSFSGNGHNQNSVYGDVLFVGDQTVLFGQLTWFKKVLKHDLTIGSAYRYTRYNDNTVATPDADEIHLPGVFFQDELKVNKQNTLLFGARYDYNSNHGNVFSPRINYKWMSKNRKNIFRLTAGNGFRVVNLFTEDHASISGTRTVIVDEELNPETSWNGNLNYVKKFLFKNDAFLSLDFSGFYTYFTNQILPDYDAQNDAIIYSNLDGYAVSKGVSANTDLTLKNGFSVLFGSTLMDVSVFNENVKKRQQLTERFTATWGVSYSMKKRGVQFDYTGNLYGPMLLPLQDEEDVRDPKSPYWSIQNIQVTKRFKNGVELFGGIKNLLNYTLPLTAMWALNVEDIPRRTDGTFNPFDEENGARFDPAYIWAPNQGVRGNFGVRFNLKK